MRIERVRPPFEAVVVYNTYTDFELEDVWKELNFLTNERVMRPPTQTGSALDDSGNVTKKNKAVFLYETYCVEQVSPILTYTPKLFNTDIMNSFIEINPIHEMFGKVNSHTTLLSYYEEADRYDFHHDECLYTSVTYVFKEPKKFSGGDISFRIGNDVVTFEVQNNMTIIFPSLYNHAVSPVVMEEDCGSFSGMGRYCISQFMNYIPR